MNIAQQLEQRIRLIWRDPLTHDTARRWAPVRAASPRATIALDRCARANAWLDGRSYVTPEDIQALAPDVLRHRVLLNYEAEADGIDPDRLISILLDAVAVP